MGTVSRDPAFTRTPIEGREHSGGEILGVVPSSLWVDGPAAADAPIGAVREPEECISFAAKGTDVSRAIIRVVAGLEELQLSGRGAWLARGGMTTASYSIQLLRRSNSPGRFNAVLEVKGRFRTRRLPVSLPLSSIETRWDPSQERLDFEFPAGTGMLLISGSEARKAARFLELDRQPEPIRPAAPTRRPSDLEDLLDRRSDSERYRNLRQRYGEHPAVTAIWGLLNDSAARDAAAAVAGPAVNDRIAFWTKNAIKRLVHERYEPILDEPGTLDRLQAVVDLPSLVGWFAGYQFLIAEGFTLPEPRMTVEELEAAYKATWAQPRDPGDLQWFLETTAQVAAASKVVEAIEPGIPRLSEQNQSLVVGWAAENAETFAGLGFRYALLQERR